MRRSVMRIICKKNTQENLWNLPKQKTLKEIGEKYENQKFLRKIRIRWKLLPFSHLKFFWSGTYHHFWIKVLFWMLNTYFEKLIYCPNVHSEGMRDSWKFRKICLLCNLRLYYKHFSAHIRKICLPVCHCKTANCYDGVREAKKYIFYCRLLIKLIRSAYFVLKQYNINITKYNASNTVSKYTNSIYLIKYNFSRFFVCWRKICGNSEGIIIVKESLKAYRRNNWFNVAVILVIFWLRLI